MLIFIAIIIGIVVGNALWWRWADSRVRAFVHARIWRTVLAIFCGLQIAYIVLFMVSPMYSRRPHFFLPRPLLAGFYIWDLMVLPTTLVVIGVIAMSRFLASKLRAQHDLANQTPLLRYAEGADSSDSSDRSHGKIRVIGVPQTPASDLTMTVQPVVENPPASARKGNVVHPASMLTRRQWLSAAAVSLPPLIAAGATARAMAQLGDLRLRALDVAIPNLPPALDGLTIAQVTDTHIGRFTRKSSLDAVVEITNRLRADLVVFTGDLIDSALVDFSTGVDLINRLDPGSGIVMIEGNHDLIEDPNEFERRASSANLPILLDETRTLNVRGVPIQFLGVRWGQPDDGPHRKSSNTVIRDSVARVLAQRDPNAFPILLAHHPHAFDAATEAGIPLTLSGHTHGGQIMLTERLGAGSIMFKYWSGLYQRANSSLVVSNGAGNWFPLRIHAPAEIVHITLRTK